MEKTLYWRIDSNGDLSVTAADPETCLELLKGDFESLDQDEAEETEYKIYPVWLTDEEYESLPEA